MSEGQEVDVLRASVESCIRVEFVFTKVFVIFPVLRKNGVLVNVLYLLVIWV